MKRHASPEPPHPKTIPILVHESQFPGNVRRELLKSLEDRRINHKFHYDSAKQTVKWLALHELLSPFRRDPDCARIYEESFSFIARTIPSRRVLVVGIGCGGGQKDTELLRRLQAEGKQVVYVPVDVSTPMVIVAAQTAQTVVSPNDCHPVVLDLGTTDDLAAVISSVSDDDTPRLVTFFGMIPNFEPQSVLPRLAAALRKDDWLAFSANLSPGTDYQAGTEFVLPQYDNAPTREWLLTLLYDMGFEPDDGNVRFGVENPPERSDLFRIVAHFDLTRDRVIQVDNSKFQFRSGESIRLFYSFRYTPERLRALLAKFGLKVIEANISKSQEEGVFVCRRD
ncbi:MAG TPA: L-histidine N(alpha)-methyltransferase [Verrucomicrobiae bacterium]|nr:L-histidine N(alpha)-methyltransferase [Verrucomicrobiae bacterium]